MTAAAQIAAYLEHLRVERRMSAHTLDGYARDLKAFADWMPGAGLDALAQVHV